MLFCALNPNTPLQMKGAEALRDEVRAERERLLAREAVVAAAESHLETQKRDSERQSAEIHNALQVGRGAAGASWGGCNQQVGMAGWGGCIGCRLVHQDQHCVT